jgi:hypothetical protein
MSFPSHLAQSLPLDAESIHALAARSMFQLFSTMSQGMFLADRAGRIVWVNEGYQRFLPDLGVASLGDFLGHMVEEVIPNTRMRQVLETGEPVLIDLLTNRAGTFVVSRIPLKDDGGEVIGAIGIVLFDQPETTLQPLISKFALLQRDLDEARRELAAQRSRSLRVAGHGERRAKYSFASFVGSSPVAQPRAAAGRDRHRQGTAGPCHPCGIGPRQRPLRHRQHRRRARHPAGGRILRRRPGRLHRGGPQAARRQIPPGRWRHALPRRNRRHAPEPAGQAAAGLAGG